VQVQFVQALGSHGQRRCCAGLLEAELVQEQEPEWSPAGGLGLPSPSSAVAPGTPTPGRFGASQRQSARTRLHSAHLDMSLHA